jgi:hypothetical protein
LGYVVQVRGAVEVPTLPARSFHLYRFWLYGAFPELDVLLLRTHVVYERKAGREGAGEAAVLGL